MLHFRSVNKVDISEIILQPFRAHSCDFRIVEGLHEMHDFEAHVFHVCFLVCAHEFLFEFHFDFDGDVVLWGLGDVATDRLHIYERSVE